MAGGGSLDPSAKTVIESLLFVSGEPISLRQLQRVLDVDEVQLMQALSELMSELRTRGVRLIQHGETFQLVTAPECASWVEKFLGQREGSRLSAAALETLAIVAYRQPITRAGVEALRGVNSDRVIASLIARGLIEEVGQLEAPGRPALLGTTAAFLQHFGLERIEDLPPLEEDSSIQYPEDGTSG